MRLDGIEGYVPVSAIRRAQQHAAEVGDLLVDSLLRHEVLCQLRVCFGLKPHTPPRRARCSREAKWQESLHDRRICQRIGQAGQVAVPLRPCLCGPNRSWPSGSGQGSGSQRPAGRVLGIEERAERHLAVVPPTRRRSVRTCYGVGVDIRSPAMRCATFPRLDAPG